MLLDRKMQDQKETTTKSGAMSKLDEVFFDLACRAQNECEIQNLNEMAIDEIKSMASTNVACTCPSYTCNILSNNDKDVGWENLEGDKTDTLETIKI